MCEGNAEGASRNSWRYSMLLILTGTASVVPLQQFSL